MKKLIILITIALCYQVAEAQVKLIGKIRNASTMEVIPNANINLSLQNSPNPPLTAVSDELGNFTLETEAGVYLLNVTSIGYEPLTIKLGLNANLQKTFELAVATTEMSRVNISVLRAGRHVPSTTSYLGGKSIELLDQSKDFPFLLNGLPSTVISSDAGNGVGYTGIRVRGIDPTRVNVTINDIPLNDAEGQGVYWVNLPDLASSTSSVQVQRGIGTSTNGAASFGASANIQTAKIERKKFAEMQLAYGSFNTLRSTLKLGSGKLRNGWGFQGRVSYTSSDGFIDRASSELKSTQLTAEKRWKKTSLKANVMLGHERTYQAWWGIPQPKFEGDPIGLDTFVSGLGINGEALENLEFSSPSTYNYYTYQNEVDDYTQNHYQLFLTHFIDTASFFKLTGHYTQGYGYFEQFKPQESLSDYFIAPHVNGSDTTYFSDLVRRRWLDNHFYGLIASYHFTNKTVDFTLGGSANQYLGRHFGEAIQTEFTGYEALNAIYYDNDAVKNDINTYAKALYSAGNLHYYADMQYRLVDYRFEGPDENGIPSDQDVHYAFFNPKIGVTYEVLRFLDLRLMYAIGNREPVRSDFVESSPSSRPQHETLHDIEFGIEFNTYRYHLGITIYDMQYKNALVLNGQINDVGAFTRVNVKESYRQGIELELTVSPSRIVAIGGNLSFSENKIAQFTEFVDDWENGGQLTLKYENTDLAFSPTVIAAGHIDLLLTDALRIQINTKYVGDQFLDNTSSADRKLNAFQTVNAMVQYELRSIGDFKNITASFYLNNLTNQAYAPNGYTFSGYWGTRNSYNYVYPMAGTNWMFKLGMRI